MTKQAQTPSKNKGISYFAQMLTPGQIFRTYRKKKKVLLVDISEETKIPLEQLKRIENDDYSEVNDQVYMRGFVKNYSDYLGLDTEKMLAIYRRTVASQTELKRKEKGGKMSMQKRLLKALQKVNPKFKFELTPTTLISGVFTLVVLIILVYLGVQLYNFQQPPDLTVLSPLNNTVVDSDKVELTGKTEPLSVVEVNEEIVSIDTEGNFSAQVKVSEGVNTIVVRSYKNNNKDRANVIALNVTFELPAEESDGGDGSGDGSDAGTNGDGGGSDGSSDGTESSKSTVQIRIQGAPTWITLNVDGRQEIAQVLGEGETGAYEFTDSFSMVTGKPETTTVLVDGESRQISVNYSTGSSTLSCQRVGGSVRCE